MKLPLAPLFLALGVSAASAATLTIGVTGDSYIRSGTTTLQNTNNNGSQLLLVGDTTTSGDVMRGVLSFNLAAPELVGATINSVTLNLFADSAAGKDSSSTVSSTETLQIFQLTRSFVDTQVTWNNAATGTAWTTPGGDFSGTALSSVSANATTVTANQLFSFGSSEAFLNSIVGTLAQTDKTLGLYVKLQTENTTRSLFRLNAGTTTNVNIAPAAFRPQLVIDYSVSTIPEPSAFAAFAGLGALGCVGVRRRARR